MVHFPYACLRHTGRKKLDVRATVAWYPSRKEECILFCVADGKTNHIPYSSKFSRHKNFVKRSKFAKLLIFVTSKNFVIAAKFHEAWRGLIVAVVPCITTSLCLFLGCTSHAFFG